MLLRSLQCTGHRHTPTSPHVPPKELSRPESVEQRLRKPVLLATPPVLRSASSLEAHVSKGTSTIMHDAQLLKGIIKHSDQREDTAEDTGSGREADSPLPPEGLIWKEC